MTTVLSGTTVLPSAPASDDLAGTVAPIAIGSVPDGVRLDAYAVNAGDQYLSFDAAIVLGGTTFARGDVALLSGGAYTLAFSAAAAAVPDGVDVKDVALHGTNLLLAFDSAFSASGVTFTPRTSPSGTGARSPSSSTAPPLESLKASRSTASISSPTAIFSSRSTSPARSPA